MKLIEIMDEESGVRVEWDAEKPLPAEGTWRPVSGAGMNPSNAPGDTPDPPLMLRVSAPPSAK